MFTWTAITPSVISNDCVFNWTEITNQYILQVKILFFFMKKKHSNSNKKNSIYYIDGVKSSNVWFADLRAVSIPMSFIP
jgi:hypothetical protein